MGERTVGGVSVGMRLTGPPGRAVGPVATNADRLALAAALVVLGPPMKWVSTTLSHAFMSVGRKEVPLGLGMGLANRP